MKVLNNEKAPHKTVIWVEAITYEVLPTGECSGTPIEKKKVIYQIDGLDKFICLRKTNEFLEEMKNASSS